MSKEPKTGKRRPAKPVVDAEARAALVALAGVLKALYPMMPSNVDTAYYDFLARVSEFDRV